MDDARKAFSVVGGTHLSKYRIEYRIIMLLIGNIKRPLVLSFGTLYLLSGYDNLTALTITHKVKVAITVAIILLCGSDKT
ncbi:MAG: hypothetical protein RR313_06355 [Anaerovoracaceae bacterium]